MIEKEQKTEMRQIKPLPAGIYCMLRIYSIISSFVLNFGMVEQMCVCVCILYSRNKRITNA